MTILRIFLHDEELANASWQQVDNLEVIESGSGSLNEVLQLTYDQIELYLAPTLASVIHTELGSINDRRINDELLLGLVEEQLAEDIDTCKPILLRLNDGVAYIAILSRAFHSRLLEQLSEHVKQVKFIQPFPFATNFEAALWSVYLIGQNKFVRTSEYEYFVLDDHAPLPELLEVMLEQYEAKSILLYSDDPALAESLAHKYQLNVKLQSEYQYGITVWNFYNEKSKRFNIKLAPSTIMSLLRLTRSVGIFLAIYLLYWFINLGVLVYERHSLQAEVSHDLQGIVATNKYSDNLLAQVDDKLSSIEHGKGVYARNDMLSLFDTFLQTMPDVSNHMIQGITYSGSTLTIFLSSQFDPKSFSNDQAILQMKRIRADVVDYKTYQANQASSSKSTNNGGGVLNDASMNGNGAGAGQSIAASMQDVAWVISLQLISRMERLDDSHTR